MNTIVQHPADERLWRDTSSGLRFGASCFGGRNWSLKDLYQQQSSEFVDALSEKMRLVGAERVFAPTPGFNARFIEQNQLRAVATLQGGVEVFRNKALPSDMVALEHVGDACIFSAGGCPIVVACYGSEILVAHAGLSCVIDPARVQGDTKAFRADESVSHTILRVLQARAGNTFTPKEVEVWVFWSIKPKDLAYHFDHPKGGKYNRELAKHLSRYTNGVTHNEKAVRPDIPNILREQFLNAGLTEGNIHAEAKTAYLSDKFPHTRSELNNDWRSLLAVTRKR